MIVDDTPMNLFVLQMLLGEINDVELEIKTAVNGQEAV